MLFQHSGMQHVRTIMFTIICITITSITISLEGQPAMEEKNATQCRNVGIVPFKDGMRVTFYRRRASEQMESKKATRRTCSLHARVGMPPLALVPLHGTILMLRWRMAFLFFHRG